MSTGQIYRRRLKDGGGSNWYAVVNLPPVEGRRRQRSATFGTKREAELWSAEQVTPRRDGALEQLTWERFLPQWLAGKPGLKASTAASYQAHIDRYLLPEFGKVPLTKLNAQMVRDWHHRLLEQGVSAATVRRIHATFSSAVGSAKRQDLLGPNPLAGVELPAVTRPTMQVWTVDQAQDFLRHTATDPLATLWRLALMTGLRRGELLGLRRSDIDPQCSTLQVRSNRVAVGRATVVGPPMSRDSRRDVVMDEITAGVMRRHLGSRPVVVPIRSTGLTDDWLFVDAAGDPISPAWLSRRFTQLCRNAGVPVIRFKDLRHTSAMLGLDAGEDLKSISARLGHSRVNITANLYAQDPLPVARQDASRLPDWPKSDSTPVELNEAYRDLPLSG